MRQFAESGLAKASYAGLGAGKAIQNSSGSQISFQSSPSCPATGSTKDVAFGTVRVGVDQGQPHSLLSDS